MNTNTLQTERLTTNDETMDCSTSRIQKYADQLQGLYVGGNWLDESYNGKLDDVDEDLAFREPFLGGNTIAGILWHCTVSYTHLTLPTSDLV